MAECGIDFCGAAAVACGSGCSAASAVCSGGYCGSDVVPAMATWTDNNCLSAAASVNCPGNCALPSAYASCSNSNCAIAAAQCSACATGGCVGVCTSCATFCDKGC